MVSPTEEMPSRKRIVPMPPHASAAGQRQCFVANGAGTTRSDLVLVGRIDVGSLNLRIVMASTRLLTWCFCYNHTWTRFWTSLSVGLLIIVDA